MGKFNGVLFKVMVWGYVGYVLYGGGGGGGDFLWFWGKGLESRDLFFGFFLG